MPITDIEIRARKILDTIPLGNELDHGAYCARIAIQHVFTCMYGSALSLNHIIKIAEAIYGYKCEPDATFENELNKLKKLGIFRNHKGKNRHLWEIAL